jgi:hypothetical protein
LRKSAVFAKNLILYAKISAKTLINLVIFAKIKICGENDKRHFCFNPSEGPEWALAFPLNV